jgi:hypothetical protein
MKKITMIAGMASVATVAAVMWSVPASAGAMCGSSACAVVHNRWPGRPIADQQNSRPSQTSTASGVPEPGMIPLLALGLGGVGFLALRRKRAQV